MGLLLIIKEGEDNSISDFMCPQALDQATFGSFITNINWIDSIP